MHDIPSDFECPGKALSSNLAIPKHKLFKYMYTVEKQINPNLYVKK